MKSLTVAISRQEPPPIRVLVVDDHDDIREPVATYLGRQGFRAVTADGATGMHDVLRHQTVDAIVLDVMLTDGNGVDLCRQISADNGPPVILLTAMSDHRDRIAGLDAGADDYLLKPFDPGELAARIRSVLRRAARGHRPHPAHDATLAFDGWHFNPRERSLRDPKGLPVRLSEAEARLLQALLTHAGEVLSRDQLMDLTQQSDSYAFDRSIDVQICRLRKRLSTDGPSDLLIRTVRGGGYLFTAQVELQP